MSEIISSKIRNSHINSGNKSQKIANNGKTMAYPNTKSAPQTDENNFSKQLKANKSRKIITLEQDKKNKLKLNKIHEEYNSYMLGAIYRNMNSEYIEGKSDFWREEGDEAGEMDKVFREKLIEEQAKIVSNKLKLIKNK